jgi:hypothetical protein
MKKLTGPSEMIGLEYILGDLETQNRIRYFTAAGSALFVPASRS